MNVVTTADANYALPLRVMLRSVVDFHPEADIHVLDCGLYPSAKQKAERTLGRDIDWVKVPNEILPPLDPNPIITSATYARLAMHLLLPTTNKVVYLDADTLVLGELDDLYEIPLDHHVPIAAAPDTGLPAATPQMRAELPKVTTYFNAGVLVADLAQWRREAVHAWFPSLIGKAGPFHDQCILNTVFDNRVEILDTKWNWQGHRTEPMPAGTKIAHYVGADKPWLPRRAPRPNHDLYHKAMTRVC